MEKPSCFIMDFKILMKFYYITNTFDLQFFDNEMTAVLNSFEICTEKRFVSLFYLNERKITTSLLMIHVKCTVAQYAYLSSSSISKLF